MSKLNFDYVPLTFINDKDEIRKQIKNTLILIYLFEKFNTPTRLEALIEGTQYGFNASAQQSGKNKFLRISDIHESKVNWEKVPYCDCSDENTYLLKTDDILIARTGGTTGKSFKINNPPKHSIYAGYLIRIRAKVKVNSDYIYLFLHSFAYWSQIVNLNEGNFRPKANAENLKALILPDCPKHIQDEAVRISKGERVDGYEHLFDKIEKTLSCYEKNQEIQQLLIDQLRQIGFLNHALMNEALQGKLVQQDCRDEPAGELIKRIKIEKLKLGKKEKSLPVIGSHEMPFEIPKSWSWCRLSDLRDFRYSLSYGVLVPGENVDDGIPFVRVQDLDSAENNEFPTKSISRQIDAKFAKTRLVGGEILICVVGSIGKVALSSDKWIGGNIARAVCRFMPNQNVSRKYLYYCLTSPYVQELFSIGKKSINPTLNVNILETTPIPLPPAFEQKRIVLEIEKQLSKSNKLKSHVKANQDATDQLLKGLLHEAFIISKSTKHLEERTGPKVVAMPVKKDDTIKVEVMAAEIIWQLHKEPTFGHLKLQKLIYLCQKTADMDLSTNFLKQAMGPYDPKLMRSLDSTLRDNSWFDYQQTGLLKYKPLQDAGNHRRDYDKYFSEEKQQIQFLIDNFRSLKSEVIEIVATLYACLDTILNEKVIFSEALLVKRFFDWSEEKGKFSEKQVSRVFKRMIETGIVPAKFTELTSHIN